MTIQHNDIICSLKKTKIIVAIVYWNLANDPARKANLDFCWEHLQKLVGYSRNEGVDIVSFLFEFGENRSHCDSILIDGDLGKLSYDRSKKINRALRYIEEFSPDIVGIIDSDVFVSEKHYTTFATAISELNSNEFFSLKLLDIVNHVECIDRQNCTIDYGKIISNERKYINGIPGLGGLFFCDYRRLLDSGGFDERFITWGGEDDEIAYRLQREGVFRKVVEITAYHLPHPSVDVDIKQYSAQSQLVLSSILPKIDHEKDSVIFIMYPAIGHYVPALPLMGEFSKLGYNVIVCGTELIREFINNQGFFFYNLEYIKDYRIDNVSIFVAILIKSLFDKRFARTEYREFLVKAGSITKLLKFCSPSIVFVDQDVSFYNFLLKSVGKVYLLNTRQVIERQKGIPPLSSSWIPPNLPWIRNIGSNILWTIENFNNLVIETAKTAALLGRTESLFLQKYVYRKPKSYRKVKSIFETIVPLSAQKGVVLNLCIDKFEYPWREAMLNQKFLFIGLGTPKFAKTQDTLRNNDMYLNQRVNIWRKDANIKIVFCSFGSMTASYSKQCRAFFLKIIDAVCALSNVKLILITGSIDLSNKAYDYERIAILSSCNQQEIIKFADVVVAHGGMNSINEAIYAEVPIIVFPLNRNGDNPGNSARVVFHKLGVRGTMRYNAKQISKKILYTLDNVLYFKNNIVDFKSAICEQNFVDIGVLI